LFGRLLDTACGGNTEVGIGKFKTRWALTWNRKNAKN